MVWMLTQRVEDRIVRGWQEVLEHHPSLKTNSLPWHEWLPWHPFETSDLSPSTHTWLSSKDCRLSFRCRWTAESGSEEVAHLCWAKGYIVRLCSQLAENWWSLLKRERNVFREKSQVLFTLFSSSTVKQPVLLKTPEDWIILTSSNRDFVLYHLCSPLLLVSSRPRPQRWVWYRADLLDAREENQASPNKLVARGEKLCSHNLLMVCKLGLSLASSALLHLSPQFHSSNLPSLLMLGPFSLARKEGC